MKVHQEKENTVLTGPEYQVTIMPDRLLVLIRKGRRFYYGMRLISAIDTLEGLDAALQRKEQARPRRERKLDSEGEARLIALACSEPPDGRSRWTLELLADELVRLDVVDSISAQTVRRTLKKTNSSPTARGVG